MISGAEALARLREGNRRFVADEGTAVGIEPGPAGSAGRQHRRADLKSAAGSDDRRSLLFETGIVTFFDSAE
jgi:hypothetical protein